MGLFSWWYGAGWQRCVQSVRDNLLALYDYFSIDLLVKALFSPWRQISAGKVRGNVQVQLHALLDNLISRIIGGFIRSIVIIFGSLTLLIMSIVGLLRIILWPLTPVLPVVFVIFAVIGWVP